MTTRHAKDGHWSRIWFNKETSNKDTFEVLNSYKYTTGQDTYEVHGKLYFRRGIGFEYIWVF